MQRALRFNIQHPKAKEMREEKGEARFWERAQQILVEYLLLLKRPEVPFPALT